MSKRAHPAHRMSQYGPAVTEIEAVRSDNAKMISALRDCLTEMEMLKEDCDHSVGICWCSFHRAMENAQALIEAHERSEKFMAALDAE